MVDIHTHIMPHVDDGSDNIEETIKILKKAKLAGYDTIVATPHYIEGSYDAGMPRKTELIDRIRKEAKNNNIDIKIYLGNEIFISENVLKNIKDGNIATMNNTSYILVELPLNDEIVNFQSYLFEVISSGYTPILAHPERYAFVKKNPNALIPYINQGVLIQINSGSLMEHYGKTAKKTAEILLKHNMVHIVATDTHHAKNVTYDEIDSVKKQISKLVGFEHTDVLMSKNPRKIVHGEYIDVDDPIYYKKKFFEKW